MLSIKKKPFIKGAIIMTFLIILSLMLMPTSLFGANMYGQKDAATLESDETVNGPGFFGGSIVRIDGTVEGTTFIGGQDVTINGTINGDLICTAQNLTINGIISGNIYGVGQSLTFKGQQIGDAFLAGQNITIGEDAEFNRDLFAAGQTTIFNGTVQRDFHGVGLQVLITGSIGRDADLEGENIKIEDTAIINGNLFYKSENEANISSSAQITGETDWQYVEYTPEPEEIREKIRTPFAGYAMKLYSIISMLLLWFIIRIWKPEAWETTSKELFEQPLRTLGIGAIALIMTPILAALLMVTVIGIPIGILLGIAYGVSLYLSKLITAIFIGSWLAKHFGWPEIHKGIWLVLLGLLIVNGLSMIPILKILIRFIIIFTGLGAIVAVNLKKKPENPIPEIKTEA